MCNTLDGSISLKNSHYNESFHSHYGALKESREKFINPSELDRFNIKRTIFVLDVCLGIGYNTASLIEKLQRSKTRFHWWGLEIDKRPLKIALGDMSFRSTWSTEVLKILTSIKSKGSWKESSSEGRVIWGDARQRLKEIPEDIFFDIIMLDAFSPKKCPQLWTEEFLHMLTNKLATDGRIITYCSAASLRKTLRDAGLLVMSLLPVKHSGQEWSSGTIGIKRKGVAPIRKGSNLYRPLSIMEEDHLKTRAAIPYRDPTGHSTAEEIIKRREKDQLASLCKSTSSWKKKWKNAE